MKDETENPVTSCLGALFWLFTTPLWMILRGFVVSRLWHWFIVSKFGVPEIDIAEAIGISLLIRYFTVDFSDQPNKQPFAEKLATVIAAHTLTLLTGWIVYHFFIAGV